LTCENIVMKDLLVFFCVGPFLIFVGVLQIQNVRRALKTGVIALGARDTSRLRAIDRNKNPFLYHLNFWPCLFAAIVLPILGIGFIGYGIFLLVNP
jgi:hypothetical protein